MNPMRSRNHSQLPPVHDTFQHYTLYETKQKFYVIASNKAQTVFRMLKIDRSDDDLTMMEDVAVYDRQQLAASLGMIHAANSPTGGLTKIVTACSIAGFVRFMRGYYMLLITGKKRVGSIGGHVIYAVTDTRLVYLPHPEVPSDEAVSKKIGPEEARYKSLFLLIDLTKNFFFSYTYNLTRSLQFNMNPNHAEGRLWTNSIFVWNNFLMKHLVAELGESYSNWTTPLIQGFFEQRPCSVFGRSVTITLISRRSRLYAGTRYLKRGINDQGQVANDVESEQIIHDRSYGDPTNGQFASYLQMRASIPLFWTQESNAMVAKPSIQIQKVDPVHKALRLHFSDIFRRYGAPVLVLNLVRQKESPGKEREIKVGKPFGEGVELINQFMPKEMQLDYFAWDYKRVSKSKNRSVDQRMSIISEWSLQRTGFFHSHPTRFAHMVTPRETLSKGPLGPRKAPVPPPTFPSHHHFSSPIETLDVQVPQRDSPTLSHNRSKPAKALTSVPDDPSLSQEASSPISRAASLPVTAHARSAVAHRVALPDEHHAAASASSPPIVSPVMPASSPPIVSPVMPASSRSARMVHTKPTRSARLRLQELPGKERTMSRERPVQKQRTGILSGFPLRSVAEVHSASPSPSPPLNGRTALNISSPLSPKSLAHYQSLNRQPSPGPGHSSLHQPPPPPGAPKPSADAITGDIDIGWFQSGVCRSNCIDSLDRTNDAQSRIGIRALAYQLYAFGLTSSKSVDPNSEISRVLENMYFHMGDSLALQYGGSQMHRQIQKNRESTASANGHTESSAPQKKVQSTKPKEMLISLMRHYQNSFQDNEKQDAINLFLGRFIPSRIPGNINLWELGSDFYLHNKLLTIPPANFEVPLMNHDRWWELPLAQFRSTLTHYPPELRGQVLAAVGAGASDPRAQSHLLAEGKFDTPADVRTHALSSDAPSADADQLVAPRHLIQAQIPLQGEEFPNPLEPASDLLSEFGRAPKRRRLSSFGLRGDKDTMDLYFEEEYSARSLTLFDEVLRLPESVPLSVRIARGVCTPAELGPIPDANLQPPPYSHSGYNLHTEQVDIGAATMWRIDFREGKLIVPDHEKYLRIREMDRSKQNERLKSQTQSQSTLQRRGIRNWFGPLFSRLLPRSSPNSLARNSGKRKNDGRKDTGDSEGGTSSKDRNSAYGDTDIFTKGMDRNDLALPRAVLKDDSAVREFMKRQFNYSREDLVIDEHDFKDPQTDPVAEEFSDYLDIGELQNDESLSEKTLHMFERYGVHFDLLLNNDAGLGTYQAYFTQKFIPGGGKSRRRVSGYRDRVF